MIENSIRTSKLKPAFIPFITAGYPDLETTKELLFCLEKNGAAAIELGLPFSDPLADGAVIQEAAKQSIEGGTNVNKVFNLLEEIKGAVKTPIILFTYYNLVLNYGEEAFVKRAKRVGVSGFILPDLPFEESVGFNALCKDAGLDFIMLVAPTSGEERIKIIAKNSSGFIYVVSSTGVTGVRESFSDILTDMVTQIKSVTDTPIAVGFGVSKPEQIKSLAKLNIDGAIIGSAIIRLIKQYRDDRAMLSEKLTEYIKELYPT